MNPSDQNPPNKPLAEAWFESTPTPNVPTPPPAKSPKRKRTLIVILALLVASLGILAVFLLLRPFAAPCLTSDDYELLTGETADPQMSATENFYSTSLLYKNKTDQYIDNGIEDNEDKVTVVGQLFKYRSENSSMIVTLSADYTSNDTASAAAQRIANLKNELVKMGVDESAIKTKEPTATATSSEEISPAKVYITITSDPGCRQP